MFLMPVCSFGYLLIESRDLTILYARFIYISEFINCKTRYFRDFLKVNNFRDFNFCGL